MQQRDDARPRRLDHVAAQALERRRARGADVEPGRRAASQQELVGVDAVVRDALVDVHVQVDEARHDEQPAHVQPLRARQLRPDLGDAPTRHAEVGDAIEPGRGIEQAAAGEHEVVAHAITPCACIRRSERSSALTVSCSSSSPCAIESRPQPR